MSYDGDTNRIIHECPWWVETCMDDDAVQRFDGYTCLWQDDNEVYDMIEVFLRSLRIERVTVQMGSEGKERYFDTIVIGAGLSGVAAGYRLQTQLPNQTYAILEGRDTVGGTWDLFRYPGIRSDSDMYTLGYSFSPWLDTSSLAPGGLILSYIKSTVEKYKISKNIHLNTKVIRMEWNSATSLWTLTCSQLAATVVYTCRFVFGCTGYYNYSHGYEPSFPGTEKFEGKIVHPQKWPDNLDYSGKKVVVIGSGATAVTIVPEMAKLATHVTMLQRSPTFVSSTPSKDKVGAFLMSIFPPSWSHWINRWLHILQGTFIYSFCRACPDLVRRAVLKEAKQFIGDPSKCDVKTHFSPSYKPWDERFCLVPDGDIFRAIGSGKASVRTANIVTFTKSGIEIINKSDQSSEHLDADIVVTATGLSVQVLGGIEMFVDGENIIENMSKKFSYKGIMVSGVPNFALSVGYTNLTFTLKADLIGIYVTRLLRYMDKHGYKKCMPVYGKREDERDPSYRGEDLISLSSGYIRRSVHLFPRQGKRSPWRYYNNYFYDMMEFYFGSLEDGVMEYH